MEVTFRFGKAAGWVILAAAAVSAAWLLHEHRQLADSRASISVVAPEVPVVMRTAGGLLEIATVTAYERFTRSDTRQFWGLDLGTTVSQIQVKAVYRYHVELAREWPMTIKGTTCIVHAGPVRPSLPVAFDSSTLQKFASNGWARFNKEQSLASLERSMTPELKLRAGSESYLGLAREAGRKTIAEFVTNWLRRERDWKFDPAYRVIVLFPGEDLESSRGRLP